MAMSMDIRRRSQVSRCCY